MPFPLSGSDAPSENLVPSLVRLSLAARLQKRHCNINSCALPSLDLLTLSDSAASLKGLSSALHARGMALMVDIIVNDVAFPLQVATSKFDPTIGNPPNKTNQGLYGPFGSLSYFHPACAIDTSSQTSIEQCASWREINRV